MTAVPVRDGSIAASFGSADWSLSAHGRVGDGEFHPYPARYIPALPRQIMSLLGVADGLVLDPFCGSGTTLAEARRRGLSSVGIDINPIATLISRVRTSRWESSDSAALGDHLRALREAAASSTDVGAEFADIPRLDHWFPDYAQVALSGAVRYVRSIPQDDPWHDRLAVSVSAATVRLPAGLGHALRGHRQGGRPGDGRRRPRAITGEDGKLA